MRRSVHLLSRSLPPITPPSPAVILFLAALAEMTEPAGTGGYGFLNANGECHGVVQLIVNPPMSITIHRLWALQPSQGAGTLILGTLCDLADRHGVELTLKCVPFGRKPYPISRDQMVAWYQRNGFEGNRRRMSRKPRVMNIV